jgi:hypothetical protein
MTASRVRRATGLPRQVAVVNDEQPWLSTAPYDENLLACTRIDWQLGDWPSLATLDYDALQNHPDRAKLVLFAAAALLQTDNFDAARRYIGLARDWGGSRKDLLRILVAGVHNTLGRAAALGGQKPRAIKHFERSITVGTPGTESRLTARARINEQLAQLDLPATEYLGDVLAGKSLAHMSRSLLPMDGSDGAMIDALKEQKDERVAQLQKQDDDLVHVRKSLEATLKKEVLNAARQIEAYLSIQNYFNTGHFTAEMHRSAVSPDFGLYLIELLETGSYDVVVEFGSGLSTVIIAKAINKITPPGQHTSATSFVSYDHLQRYYDKTRARLKQTGLDGRVQLTLAPLSPYAAANGKTYAYYDCQETLVDLARKHASDSLRMLVVVDGPPGTTGLHARYPALPMILAQFGKATIDFVLDDYSRTDERDVVKIWCSELTQMQRTYEKKSFPFEKGALFLRVEAQRGVYE